MPIAHVEESWQMAEFYNNKVLSIFLVFQIRKLPVGIHDFFYFLVEYKSIGNYFRSVTRMLIYETSFPNSFSIIILEYVCADISMRITLNLIYMLLRK